MIGTCLSGGVLGPTDTTRHSHRSFIEIRITRAVGGMGRLYLVLPRHLWVYFSALGPEISG